MAMRNQASDAVVDTSPPVGENGTDATKQGKVIALSTVMDGQSSTPAWVGAKNEIDEVAFAKDFCSRRHIALVENALCNLKGLIDEVDLRRWILDEIEPYVKSSIASKVDNLVKAMMLVAPRLKNKCHENMIHFANGTYVLHEGFSSKKMIVPYRIPVKYDEEAKRPERFIQFMNELFYPEDQACVLEYLSYCLIPSTRGQACLIITSRGGEGKSRLGVLMQNILQSNATPGKVSNLEASKFALASLEHKLLMIDDELDLCAMRSTEKLKMLITNSTFMEIEQKNQPARPARLYARILAFSNGNLQTLHDRSVGFWRRQICIEAKEKDPNRVDDPYLDEKLKAEIPGIMLLLIEHLERLHKNNFKFTISERTKKNMMDNIEEQDSTLDFLSSTWVEYDPKASESTKLLYAAYSLYCDENTLPVLSKESFRRQLTMRSKQFNISASKNIRCGNSVVRGFRGVRIKNASTVKQAQNKAPSRVSSGIIDDDPVPSGNLEDEWIDLPDEDDEDDILADLEAQH